MSALLDRAARRMQVELEQEVAAMHRFPYFRLSTLKAAWWWIQSWVSERKVARLLSKDGRTHGIFLIGRRESAIMPPWLAGDLVEILGAGVTMKILAELKRAHQAEKTRCVLGSV